MAGLSAAAWSVQNGRSVVLVEKGELGGSAVHAGFIWTAPSLDVLRSEIPDGDAQLGARLIDDFGPCGRLGPLARRRVPAGGRGASLRPRPSDRDPELSARVRGDDPERRRLGDPPDRRRRERCSSRTARFAVPSSSCPRERCARSAPAQPFSRPAGFRPTPSCARRSSIRTRGTSRCAGIRTAPATGCGSARTRAGASTETTPASTGTSCRPRSGSASDEDFPALTLYYSEHAVLLNLDCRALRRRDRRRPPHDARPAQAARGARAPRLRRARPRGVDPPPVRRGHPPDRHVRHVLPPRRPLRGRARPRRARARAAGVGLRRRRRAAGAPRLQPAVRRRLARARRGGSTPCRSTGRRST